jgi:hypothetical protein
VSVLETHFLSWNYAARKAFMIYKIENNLVPNARQSTYIEKVLNGKFFKLTPVKFLGFSRSKNKLNSVFECLCDCGNQVQVLGKKLSGKNPKNIRKSCGCIDLGCKNPRFKGCGEISLSKWSTIKNRALNDKIKFNLIIEDIWNLFLKQNRKCAISGETLKFDSCLRVRDGNASLDRIDSSEGYEIDNVQWVHKEVNLMKNALSEKTLFDWCKKIVINQKLL